MKTIQLSVEDKAVLNVLSALEPYVSPDQIKLFTEEPIPSPQEEANKIADELALKIANAIRPKPNQTMRLEALKFALKNGDTFWDQEGESDPAMRNALGALSKAMRAIFPIDQSPIDRIARRVKHFDKLGTYLGTRYSLTPLGARVRKILETDGVL